MITKEQALTYNNFRQIADNTGRVACINGAMQWLDDGQTVALNTPINWRRNGKTKIYKRASNAYRFSVPVRSGLYAYAYDYITDENAHLFEAVL